MRESLTGRVFVILWLATTRVKSETAKMWKLFQNHANVENPICVQAEPQLASLCVVEHIRSSHISRKATVPPEAWVAIWTEGVWCFEAEPPDRSTCKRSLINSRNLLPPCTKCVDQPSKNQRTWQNLPRCNKTCREGRMPINWLRTTLRDYAKRSYFLQSRGSLCALCEGHFGSLAMPGLAFRFGSLWQLLRPWKGLQLPCLKDNVQFLEKQVMSETSLLPLRQWWEFSGAANAWGTTAHRESSIDECSVECFCVPNSPQT